MKQELIFPQNWRANQFNQFHPIKSVGKERKKYMSLMSSFVCVFFFENIFVEMKIEDPDGGKVSVERDSGEGIYEEKCLTLSCLPYRSIISRDERNEIERELRIQ